MLLFFRGFERSTMVITRQADTGTKYSIYLAATATVLADKPQCKASLRPEHFVAAIAHIASQEPNL